MFLGIAASAGRLLGPMTTAALRGSDVALPEQPPRTESSSCTLWGSGTGAPITASRRQGTLHQKPVPCKSQQLLH